MSKILQINCVYDYGSTGKITKDLHNVLKSQGFESVVLYGRRQESQEKDIIKTCSEFEAKANNVLSRFTGRPYAVSPIGTHRTIAELEREKPDVVHLHCINGFFVNIYTLLDYLKKKKIPTVLTLHAEFMYTGNCGYAFDCNKWKTGCEKCPDRYAAIRSKWFNTTHKNWLDMKNAFDGFDKLQICAVSDWVKMRAEQSPILNQYPISTVLNGIDTEVFHYCEDKARELRHIHEVKDKKIILHVTANFQNSIKGGKYITELSNKLDPEKYVIIVVDGNNNNRPEDFRGIYWGKAKSQQELAALYSAADVMVITSKRECLPTTCVESLCCGTSIVCFDFHDGYGESSFPSEYVDMVPYGDVDLLEKKVIENLEKGMSKRDVSKEMKKVFGKSVMVERYIEMYTMLDRDK